jgi:hypothetical protein
LVTIKGTGFTDVTNVAIGGVSAEVASAFATSLTIKVPVGTVGGPITVTNAIGTGVSPVRFTVSGPQISGLSPASGLPGDRVTISGSGFVDVSAVTFSGLPAEILDTSTSGLQVRVPASAETGAVAVTNYLGTALSPVNFLIVAPKIKSFSPVSGTVGTRVTVSGSGFSGLVSLEFNGVPAQVLAASATSITVRVPAGATTGPLAVEAATGTGISGTNFSVN